MKKEYESPIIEIINFDKEDVITTSSFDPEGILGKNGDDWFA